MEEAYEKKAQEQAKREQAQQMRQEMLSQIMSPDAKERLVKVKLVKPEKATLIENSLITAAQNGTLKNRVSQKDLIQLLEQQSEMNPTSKVTFKRRGIDDDW